MEKRRLSSYYGMFATYGCDMLERLYTIRKWREEMLNIEKYENELRKYGVYFALTKEGSLVDCKDIHCVDCAFNVGCAIKRMNWLLEEYKEPLLSDDGINYLMTLILPYGLNELNSIIKINTCDELKYKLCVYLTHCIITVYLERGTELFQWFDNLENGKYYNAKDLGL